MPPSTGIDSDEGQHVGVDAAAIVNKRALRGGGATHWLAIEEGKRDHWFQSARKPELPCEICGRVVQAGRRPCGSQYSTGRCCGCERIDDFDPEGHGVDAL